MPTACGLATLLLLIAAAYSDVRWRTIPNGVSAGIAAAFAVAAVAEPAAFSPVADIATAMAVFAAGALLFALHALGGGDVKLLAAVTLWAGSGQLLTLLTVTAIAGGVLALAVAGWHWAGRYLTRPASQTPTPTVPYGLAIAVGGGVALMARL